MLKKTFTFKDLDGNEVSETYYFSVNTAELAEMALTHDGDIVQALQAIVASGDGKAIIAKFKDFIAMSVGERSSDGRSFIKNDAIRERFMGTEAYGQLFLELVTNAESGAEFIRGIMPADLAKRVAEIEATNAVKTVDVELPVERKALTVADFTEEQLMTMPQEELVKLYSGEMFTEPKWKQKTVDDYSSDELFAMTQEAFDQIAGTDAKKWSKRVLIVAMRRRANQ